MYLSVIIPAFNEEKRIGATLHAVNAYLCAQSYNSEIIVVNDGSYDKTVSIAESLHIKNLRIIDNQINRGKGYAVRRGLCGASGEYRLFMDADYSTQITEIEKLFPFIINGYDIAIGSRSVPGATILKPQPRYRVMLGKLYNGFIRLVLGLGNIQDTQCGFKIFTRESVKHIMQYCTVNGWSFDGEILLLAKKLNYRIKEVPMTWSNGTESKMNLRGMVQSIIDLLKIRWNLVTGRYRLKP